jgi:threonine/homoserine/homoserine lactone efflux protein
MGWADYGGFLGLAVVLVLLPGPDFAVVTRNTLAGGTRRGRWTAAGVFSSNLGQGTAAATGLSAVVLRIEPLFEAVKWAGVAYLALLGAQALGSALRGRGNPGAGATGPAPTAGSPRGGWRQGFLSNITNPKVLVFYVAVLPQFLHAGAPLGWVLLFAWSHAVLSLAYLVALTALLAGLREVLFRRRVRRAVDAATGAVLLGFGASLALESVG